MQLLYYVIEFYDCFFQTQIHVILKITLKTRREKEGKGKKPESNADLCNNVT